MSFSNLKPSGIFRQGVVAPVEPGDEKVVGFARDFLLSMEEVGQVNAQVEFLKGTVADLEEKLAKSELSSQEQRAALVNAPDADKKKALNTYGEVCFKRDVEAASLAKAREELADASARLSTLCSPQSSVGKLARMIELFDSAESGGRTPAAASVAESVDSGKSKRRDEEPSFSFGCLTSFDRPHQRRSLSS
jgi:hypothetical protein